MTKHVLTGFDSAWTLNNCGAIVSLVAEDGRRQLNGPERADFRQALLHIEQVGQGAANHVVAIDQPLVVKNKTGSRPVEQAVSSLMGKFHSGVQPANLGNVRMFGNGAPVSCFLEALERLGYRHVRLPDDWDAADGRLYFEVYPALGNLGLFPNFYERVPRSVPKYNPMRRKTFRPEDWCLLCDEVSRFLEARRVRCDWLSAMSVVKKTPQKADQDKVDALICLCHAISWAERAHLVVVGDLDTGYMVVPTHNDIANDLQTDAASKRVGFWSSDSSLLKS